MRTPCERNKCILFPACKAKKTIRCDTLYRYIVNLNSTGQTWYRLKKTFPNALKVLVEYPPHLLGFFLRYDTDKELK